MALSYNGDRSVTNASSNHSSGLYTVNTPDGDSSSGTWVELYAVVACFCLFLVASSLGFGFNLGLLVATRCKRSIRSLHYGLALTLLVVSLLSCLVWPPFHLAQLVENYNGRGFPGALCSTGLCLFHVCLGIKITSTVFIGIQRIYQLGSVYADHVMWVVVVGLVICLVILIAFPILYSLQLIDTISVSICKMPVTDGVYNVTYGTAVQIITAGYFIGLLCTLCTLVSLVLKQQRRVGQLQIKREQQLCDGLKVLHEATEPLDPARDPSPVAGSKEPSPSRTPAQQANQSFLARQFAHLGSKRPTNPEDEEDDDTFDLKMQLRMKQKAAGSGRRHTVANIGIGGSSLGGRRSSLGERASPRPKNYNYIRKWSVDIVALQNQLENPKTHDNKYPFEELAMLKERDKGSNTDVSEVAEPKTEDTDDLPGSMELLPSPDAPAVVVNGNNRVENVSNHNSQLSSGDDENIGRLEKELIKARRCVLLVLVCLICVIPFIVLQWLKPSMDINFNRNLSSVAMMFCLVQTPFHPIILAWLDPRLYAALKRLRKRLRTLRCVCYCNIGKGKHCLKSNAEQTKVEPER